MKETHIATWQGKLTHRPLRVLVIGAGGNGSAILTGLPYIHHAMLAWGFRYGLEVSLMDGDTVSTTNCVRQPFGAADIGRNKATVLISRVNAFHGLGWAAIPSFLQPESKVGGGIYPERHLDLVISCMDTRAGRKMLQDTVASPVSNVGYWLDLGNNASDGQFVLGQPLNRYNTKKGSRLRTVAELFPQIVDTAAGEDDLPSCSAAEALDKQEPFINSTLAAQSLAMIARLIRYGRIDYHGCFFNAATGRSTPLAIDPEAWKKRRRIVAKAA